MPGIHAFSVAFARMLQLIHDEWTSAACGKEFGGFDNFVQVMADMCSGGQYPEFGFLHPQLMDTPRAFGNCWTI